jgi:ketosteroid isomerase-like protein
MSTTPQQPSSEHPHLAFVRRYLAAIEARAVGETLAAFYTPDAVQREYPNRLVPAGATRDVAALLQSAERGQAVVTEQRYAVRSMLADGDTVALEVDWSARLRLPVGKLAAGDVMRASLAMFITLRDGRIASQRNYDCFEPF